MILGGGGIIQTFPRKQCFNLEREAKTCYDKSRRTTGINLMKRDRTKGPDRNYMYQLRTMRRKCSIEARFSWLRGKVGKQNGIRWGGGVWIFEVGYRMAQRCPKMN